MALSSAAPGTLDTVLNSMMDRSDTKVQKAKRKPKENETAADIAEDKAKGIKQGSPQDIAEDRANTNARFKKK